MLLPSVDVWSAVSGLGNLVGYPHLTRRGSQREGKPLDVEAGQNLPSALLSALPRARTVGGDPEEVVGLL